MHGSHAVFAAFSVALLASSCKRSAPESPHARLSNLDQLRTAFNADSGKVRAIFLASPT